MSPPHSRRVAPPPFLTSVLTTRIAGSCASPSAYVSVTNSSRSGWCTVQRTSTLPRASVPTEQSDPPYGYSVACRDVEDGSDWQDEDIVVASPGTNPTCVTVFVSRPSPSR